MTEDEMVGWHHRLNGHQFKQALGVGDGQGSLACCSPWVTKSQKCLRDWTTTWRKIKQGETTGKSWGWWDPILDGRVHEAPQKSWYLNVNYHWEWIEHPRWPAEFRKILWCLRLLDKPAGTHSAHHQSELKIHLAQSLCWSHLGSSGLFQRKEFTRKEGSRASWWGRGL